MGTYCATGGEHDIVDPESTTYDPSILARYDGPRPNRLWTYCSKCSQGYRWSVHDQQWRPWPGGLAMLPYLTDEELDELLVAVIRRTQELSQMLPMAWATGSKAELHYKLRILQSLQTAVAEARYGLFPPEGPYEPRVWGEGWNVLQRWIQVQLEGIERSSPTEAGMGATAAFSSMQAQIERMRTADSSEFLATLQAQITSSPPEPGSADLD